MKKFVLIFILLLVLLSAIFLSVFVAGFYVDFHPDAAISVPFRADGKQLTRLLPNGDYEAITLRGVNISAAVAGQYETQFSASKEDYLRWFAYIDEMGANTLRVSTILDSDFYNALYTYNTTRDRPLYLLQGLSVTDYANNNSKDAYGAGFYDELINQGKNAVDVLHGRRISIFLESSGDIYRRDVSPWVIGYLVGAEWVSDTILYTDNHNPHSNSFSGEYFYTSEDATAFEAMLARVMESLTAYETRKYKVQRMIGFINDPANDFLEYEEVYARQLLKFAKLDAERVLTFDSMRAGVFAAYNLYYFCSDFSEYLTAAQKESLAPIFEGLDTEGSYDGYVDLMAKYHSMPVIAASFGYSSSRGAVRMDTSPLTESMQGEKLAALSAELEATGWAGGFISTWQDVWERRTWNTAYSSLPGRNYLWHDLQTDGQGYGLMAFDPGKDGRVCILDGIAGEWSEAELAHEYNGVRVYSKYDSEGLYLLITKGGLTSDGDALYLPIDVSPKSGSFVCEQPGLTFSRESDFLLCLTGPDSSRLMAQERYDSTRERFLANITGVNPFANVPAKDSPVFATVYMALDNTLIFDEITEETHILKRLKTHDTGLLTHGNNDPSSPVFNSLADFCYGEGLVEVRLPWMLLNFYDPSSMQVHDDYYENYGVEGIKVEQIYIGAAEANAAEAIPMSPIPLKGWDLNVSSHERLKRSYYIMKESWGGSNAD